MARFEANAELRTISDQLAAQYPESASNFSFSSRQLQPQLQL